MNNFKKLLLLYLLIVAVSATAQENKTDSLHEVVDSIQNLVFANGVTNKKTVIGTASFYSKSLHGTKTATGVRFSNKKYTAASNNFKLNTWVRVTNLRNNKSVIVKINDRMHKKMAKKGRVVDLSRIAASELGFIKRGLTKVKVEQIDKPED